MISAIKSCFRCLRKHGARAANSRLMSRILERNGFVENKGVGGWKNSVFRASQARRGKVIVRIVPDCSKESLMPIIQELALEGSTINSDGRKTYDGLTLNGYDHYRVFHSKNEFARGKCHVNGIENFWTFAKRRLANFNGCDSDKFVVHLMECEWRYNHRNEDLYKVLSKILKRY